MLIIINTVVASLRTDIIQGWSLWVHGSGVECSSFLLFFLTFFYFFIWRINMLIIINTVVASLRTDIIQGWSLWVHGSGVKCSFFSSFFFPSPWYYRHGWLSVKNQLSIYLSFFCIEHITVGRLWNTTCRLYRLDIFLVCLQKK